MQLPQLYKVTFIIISAFFIFSINSCREETEEPIDINRIKLLNDSKFYLPGEICTLTSDEVMTWGNFTGRFIEAGIEQEVFIDEETNLYHFLVPELNTGANTLEVLADDQETMIFITVNISEYEKVENADVVIEEFTSLLDSSFLKIKNAESLGYERNEENLEACRIMIAEFNQSVVSLSESEKKQLSYFLRSNQLLNWQVEYVEIVDSFHTNKKEEDTDVSKKLDEYSKKFVEDVFSLGFLCYTFDKLILAPEAFYTKVLAVANAAVIGVKFYHLFDHMDKVLNLAGVYKKFDKIFRSKKDLEIQLLKNKPTPLNCRIEHRTIQLSDIEHASTSIKLAIGSIIKVDELVTLFKNGIERAKSIFSGKKPNITRDGNPWVNKSKTFTVNPAYFYVSDKSDPNVDLILTAADDRLLLEAIGELEAFRFKLNYKHPALEYEISEWIAVGEGILPKISNVEITDIEYKTAKATATVIEDYGDPVYQRGIVWSRITNEPTIENSKIIYADTGKGEFLVKMDFKPFHKKLIAVRAFATNSTGTSYSENFNFYSARNGIPQIKISSSRTSRWTTLINVNIYDSASSNLNGGLLYDTNPIDSFSTDTDTGYYDSRNETTGDWQFSMGYPRWPYLKNNTTYYVRFYAKNDVAGNFSNEITFSTGPCSDNLLGCNGPGGGVIVYVNDTNKWALEASTSNIGKLAFGCEETTTDVIFGEIGEGLSNCQKIVNSCNSDPAVAIDKCFNYSAGGYSNWYLPNRNEFDKLINLEDRYQLGFMKWDELYWVSEQHGKSSTTKSSAYWTAIDSSPYVGSTSGLASKSVKHWVKPFRKFTW